MSKRDDYIAMNEEYIQDDTIPTQNFEKKVFS